MASFNWATAGGAIDMPDYSSFAVNRDPELEALEDTEIDRRIRDLMARMIPLEESLGKLRAEVQRLASEQRRRERSRHLTTRMQVRTTLAEGQLPSLQQVAESAEHLLDEQLSLPQLRFFRDSGTEIGLGYATARQPSLAMTNGISTLTVGTVAEIRAKYAQGWDFGSTAHPGVRIHILGSRTEKVIPASDIYLRRRD
jgi:hypothetical protein